MRTFAATMLVATLGVLVGAPVAGASGGLLSDVTAPLADTSEPVVETVTNAAAPVTTAATPVVGSVAKTTAPVVETAAPVVQTAVEAADPVVEPVTDTVAPVVQAAKPIVDAAEPVLGAAQPVVDVAKPVVDTVASVESLVQPARGATTTTAAHAVPQHASPTQSGENQPQAPATGDAAPPPPPSAGVQQASSARAAPARSASQVAVRPAPNAEVPNAFLGRRPVSLGRGNLATGAPVLDLPPLGPSADVGSRSGAQHPDAGAKGSSRPRLPVPSLPDVPWGALSAAAGGAGGSSSALFAALAAAILLVLPRLGRRLPPALAPRPRPGFRPLLERPG